MDCNQVCQGIQQFLSNAVTNLFLGAFYLGAAILVLWLACKLLSNVFGMLTSSLGKRAHLIYLVPVCAVSCALIWGAGVTEYNSVLGAAVEWAAFLTGAAAIANLVSGYPGNRQTKDPK
jgi:hypothetical protein